MTSATTTVPLRVKADIYTLGARLLASEIDDLLYLRLAERGITPPCPLADLDHVLTELAAEYCRLFIGPDPVCVPYASAHRISSGFRGQSEREFETLLDRFQLETAPLGRFRLLAHDHIAVELAALSRILHRVAGGLPCGDLPAHVAARTLLEQHILPWVPQLLAEMNAAARLAPYTVIAPVLAELISADAVLFGAECTG